MSDMGWKQYQRENERRRKAEEEKEKARQKQARAQQQLEAQKEQAFEDYDMIVDAMVSRQQKIARKSKSIRKDQRVQAASQTHMPRRKGRGKYSADDDWGW